MKQILLLLAAAAALTVAGAAAAHDVPVDRDAVNKRFQEMGHMADRIPRMRGAARREAMHGHMHLMQEQMGAMHGMRAGHGGIVAGPDSTSGPRADSEFRSRMGSMEQRLDAMQQIMEQMLKQQELMLEDDAG